MRTLLEEALNLAMIMSRSSPTDNINVMFVLILRGGGGTFVLLLYIRIREIGHIRRYFKMGIHLKSSEFVKNT